MAVDEELGAAIGVEIVRVVKVLQALRATSPRFHEAVEQSSHPVLMSLHQEPARISELAERIHNDASVVSRQVSHLLAHGFVSKTPDPQDRRASLVTLTAAGSELVSQILAGRGRWFARILADWSPDEVRELDRMLGRLADSLQTELHSRPEPAPTRTTSAQENV